MAFIQQWPAPLNADATGSKSQDGPATTAGNDLLAGVIVRSTEATDITVTDTSGTNVWTELGREVTSSSTTVMFRCANAASVTEVTATWTVAGRGTILLAEFSGVGDLIGVESTMFPAADGGEPTPLVATDAGQLLYAVGGSQVTDRTWALSGTGVAPIAASSFQGGQTTNLTAYAYTDAAGNTAIGWDRTGGSPADFAIINALFEEGSVVPTLSVNAGPDQAVYIGQSVTLTATVSGDGGGATGLWSQISGTPATIANPSELSTSVTMPNEAGTFVFRRTETEGEQSAHDDVTITVSAAPSFVTISSVGSAAGWTPTGGNVQQVLSDSTDTTLVTSEDTPAAQVLDVTFNEIDLQAGQPLILRIRARRVDSASGSYVARLYDGVTLLSTSAPIPVEAEWADADVTFPAADMESVDFPAQLRVVTEWTAS